MGKIRTPDPVKYFCGVTYSPAVDYNRLIGEISTSFWPVDTVSPIYDFSGFTDYYQQEMGSELKKVFISFRELRSPDELPAIKLRSNRFEQHYAERGTRTVNLDPGYLELAKLVLATTKNYSHRIYLAQGIYGDIHYVWSKGSYRKQAWTYPDYQQPGIIEYFNRLRDKYRTQLQEPGGAGPNR